MSFAQITACNRHFHWALMYFEFIGFTLNHGYGNVIICSRVIFFSEEILPMTPLWSSLPMRNIVSTARGLFKSNREISLAKTILHEVNRGKCVSAAVPINICVYTIHC